MSERFTIRMDNPCSQKWADFEDRGDRGFCSSCQKEVIDFTQMSDSEIRDYFKNQPQNVCGQFKSYQLRTYSNPTASIGLSKWLSWPIAASALLFTSTATVAQERDKKEIPELIPKDETRVKSTELRLIQGTVTDKSGDGLPGVNVMLKGDSTEVWTDMVGNYQIKGPMNDGILVFSSVGFLSKEMLIKEFGEIDVVLEEMIWEEGGVVIVVGGACVISPWYTPRGIWYRTKGFFRRIF
jgi:hypothetical protein